MNLLQVRDLETHFISRDIDNRVRIAHALNGITFDVEEGEILGIVGETGAGKSLPAQSVVGLLRPPARIVGGQVRFEGRDLLTMSEDDLNAIRGNDIAMVVQNPRTSLDPLSRIGDQLIRIRRAHSESSEAEARSRAVEMMTAVGIPDPELRLSAWPHELSGGMAQRVLIAMALMNEPKLLIADEPTTGLDVTVQAQILELLRDLVTRMNMGAIIITHDLGVVAHFCDRMAVMFAGGIVETGTVGDVFENPAHPYTSNLVDATPERLKIGRKAVFGGAPPDLYNLPDGCHHRDRCRFAREECSTPPPLREVGLKHVARCHFAGELPETAQ